MKHIFLFLLIFLASANLCQANTLSDTAIVKPVPMVITVLDFEPNGVDSIMVKSVVNIIGTELSGQKEYDVVERNQVSLILKEQGFQQTGCTAKNCAVQIGKLINADKILIGSIDRLGNFIIINAKIVDIKTGIVESAENIKIEDTEKLYENILKLSEKIKVKLGVKVVNKKGEIYFGPAAIINHIKNEIGKNFYGSPSENENNFASKQQLNFQIKEIGTAAKSWVAFGTSFIPLYSGHYLTKKTNKGFLFSLADLFFVSAAVASASYGGKYGEAGSTVASSCLALFSIYDAVTSKNAVMLEAKNIEKNKVTLLSLSFKHLF